MSDLREAVLLSAAFLVYISLDFVTGDWYIIRSYFLSV